MVRTRRTLVRSVAVHGARAGLRHPVGRPRGAIRVSPAAEPLTLATARARADAKGPRSQRGAAPVSR